MRCLWLCHVVLLVVNLLSCRYLELFYMLRNMIFFFSLLWLRTIFVLECWTFIYLQVQRDCFLGLCLNYVATCGGISCSSFYWVFFWLSTESWCPGCPPSPIESHRSLIVEFVYLQLSPNFVSLLVSILPWLFIVIYVFVLCLSWSSPECQC